MAYPSLQAAFDHAKKAPAENGCLLWRGKHCGYEPRLYGQVRFGGRTIGAHVAAYEHNGREIHVGRFATLQQAEEAVKDRRAQLFSHNDHDRIAS